MKRELDFVYHVDIKNIVYKGKIGSRSKEYVCSLEFERKNGFMYMLNEKMEVVEIPLKE